MPTQRQLDIILESEVEFNSRTTYLPMPQTEPTIEHMKIAIAKFMGYNKVTVGYADSEEETEWQRNNEEWMVKVGITQVGDYAVNVKENRWRRWEDLKYSTDWNCLMEVVEKIENPQLDEKGRRIIRAAADVEIFYKACVITYEPDEESGDTNDMKGITESGETKLEAAYKAVYQFITWFNQQQKDNG